MRVDCIGADWGVSMLEMESDSGSWVRHRILGRSQRVHFRAVHSSQRHPQAGVRKGGAARAEHDWIADGLMRMQLDAATMILTYCPQFVAEKDANANRCVGMTLFRVNKTLVQRFEDIPFKEDAAQQAGAAMTLYFQSPQLGEEHRHVGPSRRTSGGPASVEARERDVTHTAGALGVQHPSGTDEVCSWSVTEAEDAGAAPNRAARDAGMAVVVTLTRLPEEEHLEWGVRIAE
eukprot:gene17820-biopygen9416